MDMNMINNNMYPCFAGRLPLDPFSSLYHIAVVLIRCVCTVYDYMCVYERFFFFGVMNEERE